MRYRLRQLLRQLGDVRRDPPRLACNAALLHCAQESVMDFASMYAVLLRVDKHRGERNHGKCGKANFGRRNYNREHHNASIGCS